MTYYYKRDTEKYYGRKQNVQQDVYNYAFYNG